jgi:pSer/pThr/pTyr-binding forkhead associated (FHA) protein
MSRPDLVLRVASELPPAEWKLGDRTVEIGRLPAADITLPHRSVSRAHARITPHATGYVIQDLGGKNGTWINDQPITAPTLLNPGDTILLGDVQLDVKLVTPASQTPAPPLPSDRPGPVATLMVGLSEVLPPLFRPPGRAVELPDDYDSAPATVEPPTLVEQAPSVPPAKPALEPVTVVGDVPPELDFELIPMPNGVPVEPAPATLARLAVAADNVAAVLRTFSSDLATAVWLFEHAGGRAAAQDFIAHVNAVYLQPGDADAQRALLDRAPTAARLLQATVLLMNGLLPVESESTDGRRDEPQANTTELEPVAGL